MTNGTLTPGHGEVDASHSETLPSPLDRPSLKIVCADIHNRIQTFLAIQDGSDVVKRTQEQTRIALGVIEKALREFGYVFLLPNAEVHALMAGTQI